MIRPCARQQVIRHLPGDAQDFLAQSAASGAGHEITLRTTSPQAPSVVTSTSFTERIVAVRSPLSTPWNWFPWRVVTRSVPLP